ncbi:MAG: hypothetical protein ACRD09_00655 [Vicinamibacterales bacterium]
MIESWRPLIAIAVATLVSEDLTTAGAGLLVRSGELSFGAAFAACALGIYAGDLMLWGTGRVVGGRVLGWPWIARRLPPSRARDLGTWIDARLPVLVLSSRFLPGSRLPLYVAAGACSRKRAAFAGWTLLAVLLWTPALLAISAGVALGPIAPDSWPARAVLAVALVVALRAATGFATREGRRRLNMHLTRLWHWEYWPAWTLYAPLTPWFALLAARYGGFRTVAAANPSIPDGGFVGESKSDILRRLPAKWTLQGFLVDVDRTASRLARLEDERLTHGLSYPLIFKPDVGQRGAGVRLIGTPDEAWAYFDRETRPVLVQQYHEGPFEAGIFYYRLPDEPRGRILGITDKRFPFVIGDDHSSIEELIWRHTRLHAQARVFLARLGDRAANVPANGERVPLGIAGNHAQGAMFLDGRSLWTEALEWRVDEIARAAGGLFIGRFDVRYSDVERFKQGEDLAVVEFNGVTAEDTSIYDPRRSIVSAWLTLARQWHLTFRIGAANRARSVEGSGARRPGRLILAHLRAHQPLSVSD